MLEHLARSARSAAPDLVEWRRYLHMHPEVSFQEHETTEWLARKMEDFKISYSRPTPTGLVGLVEGTRPGRTVAVRADIDVEILGRAALRLLAE